MTYPLRPLRGAPCLRTRRVSPKFDAGILVGVQTSQVEFGGWQGGSLLITQ